MRQVASLIDAITEHIGRVVAWAILAMVVLQFAVVLARYVYSTSTLFGVPAVWLQEGVVYLHGITILLGTAYAMLWDKNVRVDILYERASPRRQDLTELFGSLFFVLPLCALIGWAAWNNVVMSWMVREGSLEPNGLPFLFLLKALVLVFCILVAAQGLSVMVKALLRLTGRSDAPIYRQSTDL